MEILTARQLRALDEQTIHEEDITSLALMGRAASAFVEAFIKKFNSRDRPVLVVAGSGNNGGDGYVAARQLHVAGYQIQVLAADIGEPSPDNAFNANYTGRAGVRMTKLSQGAVLPEIAPGVIIIDALFGTGLSRPVTGYWAELIEHLNAIESATRVAIDLPSGLRTDEPSDGAIFQANHTYSLGYPKRALFASENAPYLGELTIVKFKLTGLEAVLHKVKAEGVGPTGFLTEKELRARLKARHTYDHKGTFGHALLVAGSFGKMGAAVISGRGVLRAGAGLVTCHVPRSGYEIMQISFPEAMCTIDPHRYMTTEINDVDKYKAIGIGPGLGTEQMTARAFRTLLQHYDKPMVVDADALNMIAKEPELLNMVPKGSILTPHPKEFERLFGEQENSFARWQVQSKWAKEQGLIILCKTAYTSIASPDGDIYVNSTGNPGMGTAGTGDALTGILTGFLAQGYKPTVAARLGVYLHGLAGDLAAAELGQEFLLAEDVIKFLGRAFATLREGVN